MTKSARPVIAVIFYQIGPYHHARLNAASENAEIIGIEWTGQEAYPWGSSAAPQQYRKATLFPEGKIGSNETAKLIRALEGCLDQSKPDLVAVNGWNDFGSLVAIRACAKRNLPMIVMSESSRYDEDRNKLKEMVKRRLVALYRTGFVGGTDHKNYLKELGMPLDRIFLGYDAVDNEYFAYGAKEVRSKREEVRKRYGLPENYFLASARFIEKKNLSRLIDAYARYRELARVEKSPTVSGSKLLVNGEEQAEGESRREKVENQGQSPTISASQLFSVSAFTNPWDLVLLGDGPLRETLNTQLSTLNLESHVHLPGFKQYQDLPAYYGLANVFIHASTTEQWGLVVNEAMASELPVLVSERCGCATDLVQEGRNGYLFDPNNIGQLADLMLRMSGAGEELAVMGQASQEIIQDWGPERFAEGLVNAAQKALELGPKPLRPNDSILLEILLRR